MLDFQLAEFWTWFSQHSDRLRSDSFDPKVLQSLDDTISNWDLSWEIGPGISKENSLTISPNGDIQLLSLTQRIVDLALVLDSWEFYSSKQPKENWMNAIVYPNVEIDAYEWSYVLLRYPNDEIEILIKADDLRRLDVETKKIAVDLILTNLLGERSKMEELDYVEVVNDFDHPNQSAKLKFLPTHLKEIRTDINLRRY
jgi:Arc/MetJ family transcription regulator